MGHYQDWLSQKIEEGFLVLLFGSIRLNELMNRIYRPDRFWPGRSRCRELDIYIVVTPTNEYAKSDVSWPSCGSWSGGGVRRLRAHRQVAIDNEWPLRNRKELYVCPWEDFRPIFRRYETMCKNSPGNDRGDYWFRSPTTTESGLNIRFYVGTGGKTGLMDVTERRVFLNARQIATGVPTSDIPGREGSLICPDFVTGTSGMDYVELHADYEKIHQVVETLVPWKGHTRSVHCIEKGLRARNLVLCRIFKPLGGDDLDPNDYANTTIAFWSSWGRIRITFNRGRKGDWAKGLCLQVPSDITHPNRRSSDCIFLEEFPRGASVSEDSDSSGSEDGGSFFQDSAPEDEAGTSQDSEFSQSEDGSSVFQGPAPEDEESTGQDSESSD